MALHQWDIGAIVTCDGCEQAVGPDGTRDLIVFVAVDGAIIHSHEHDMCLGAVADRCQRRLSLLARILRNI